MPGRSVALRGATPPTAASSVVIVDDDPTALESATELLRALGFDIHAARTRLEAFEIVRHHHVDLALIDLRLGADTGLEVASKMEEAGLAVPWVLMSRFMDFDAALEAGRRGALGAVSAPFDIEEVVTQTLARVRSRRAAGWPAPPLGVRVRQPSAAAGHAAWWILRGCDAPDDLSTIGEWAQFVRVSITQLSDAYRRLGVQPSVARDFMRVLRALVRTGGHGDQVEGELALGDYRTIENLLDRAGLAGSDDLQALSFEDFVRRQHFIAVDHQVLRGLRALIAQL